MSLPSPWLHLFFATFFVVAANAQTVVRVLHYNIHRDIGGSDSNVSAQPALAKVVNHLAPDVWTINELGGNSAGFNATTARNSLIAFINSKLTIFGPSPMEGQKYFVYVGTRSDGYITSAIVSRYPFLSTQTYSDAGSGFPALRGLVSAKVDLPGAVELGVFTAHLKAQNSTTDASKRQAQAEANAANIQAWLDENPGDAAVITGDWNETEEPSDVDNWSAGAIGGTLPNGSIYRPITTFRGTEFADPGSASIAGNRDTIDAASPDARFDYLFHRASHATLLSTLVFDTKQHTSAQLSALNSGAGTSFVSADSSSASDHLPVFSVLLASPGPALVATTSASGVASTSAVLQAGINANDSATDWRIEFGPTAALGATSAGQTLPSSRNTAPVALNVSGLRPATTYYFRVITQNASGTSTGPQQQFTTAAFVDSDGDGLPNDWETARGLNPNVASDALLDSDRDGTSNREEFAAGTDPRNAVSVFRIQSAERIGTSIAVAWASVFGKRYRLEARPSLTSGDWVPVKREIAGTGGVLVENRPIQVSAQYFRLAIEP